MGVAAEAAVAVAEVVAVAGEGVLGSFPLLRYHDDRALRGWGTLAPPTPPRPMLPAPMPMVGPATSCRELEVGGVTP